MKKFGDALREARKKNRLTLRTISEQVGKSISYLSDLEHNRRRPPKEKVVAKLEAILQVSEGQLSKLASQIRNQAPREVAQKIIAVPRLSEVLLRADEDLSDSEFNDLMDFYEKLKNRSN